MDWSKIKTVLIIALVLTNLVIGFFVLSKRSQASIMPQDEQMQLISSLLTAKSIDNQIKTYPSETSLPILNVVFEAYQLNRVSERLFSDDFQKVGDNYYNDNYELMIVEDVLIIRRITENPDKALTFPTLDISIKIAQTYIDESLGFDDDYDLIGYVFNDTGTTFTYGQRYRDKFIDNAYMKIHVTAEGVAYFERRWVHIDEELAEHRAIIPYSEALFSALNDLSQGSVLTEVSLGYRLEKNVLDTDIRSGEAMPYYRFITADDQRIFVQALLVK